MAIGGEGALPGEADEGVVVLRWRVWLLQRLAYLRDLLRGIEFALQGNRGVLVLRMCLYGLAVFMVT